MVGKLIKHDMLFYLRSLIPAELILVTMAILVRVVQFFESDNNIFEIVNVSSIVIYVIAIFVCLIMTFVTCVTRFYKNLYTAEGYLSLTLPVSHTAHIFSKLITAVSVTVISFLTIVLSVLIATAGEMANEIVKAGAYVFKDFVGFVGIHGVLYVIEIIVLMIVSLAASYLLYYTCITVGQMAKKNRVAAAFGVYFGYYVLTQILGTVATVFAAVFNDKLEKLMNNIGEWATLHPEASVHIFLLGCILASAVMGVVYFLIIRLVMKKRLNLE